MRSDGCFNDINVTVVGSKTEVEDEYEKKFEVWAEQERYCTCMIV